MSQISIVTDSTADLPPALCQEYGITVVPLKVIFGQESFRDGVDLTSGQFFQRLRESPQLPTTSQPAPSEFLAAYQPLAQRGDSIISIHLASSLSGTFQSAQLAKTMLAYPDLEVVDSRSASLGLGQLALAAARAARAGLDKEEVLAVVTRAMASLRVYFLVDTLEYLQKGGRIGRAQAFLGTLLSIKPLLALRDSGVHPLEKARGKARGLDRLAEIIAAGFPPDQPVWCGLVHGSDPEGLSQLRERVVSRLNCTQVLTAEVGPVIATHTGPGVLGVMAFPDPGV